MAEPDPFGDGGGPLRLTIPVGGVRPREDAAPPKQSPGTRRGTSDADSVYNLPAYVAPEEKPRAGATLRERAADDQSVYTLPPYVDTNVPMQPEREVSRGQAVAQGVGAGVGLGFGPAIQGLQAASAAPGGQETKQGVEQAQQAVESVNPFSYLAKKIGLPQDHETLQGLARLFDRAKISDLVTGEGNAAQQAYVRGRDTAQETQDLAAKQHPWMYYPGMVGGTLALPIGGPAAGASRMARVASAARTGAALGGVQGVGEGVSRGADLPEIAARGAVGTLAGGAIGAPFGLIAPAARIAGQTSGQRAQQTATDILKQPLARGLASDYPMVTGTTAKLRGMPLAGERITGNVEAVQHAAGSHIGDIAGGMTGGASSRAAVDTAVRPALEAVIEKNTDEANNLYNGVRGLIDENAHFTMPRTKAMLATIEAQRAASGTKPNKLREGLEEIYNIVDGATFNGAHERRSITSSAGTSRDPQPGYNAGQFKRIVGAMKADLHGMVAAAAKDQTPAGQKAAVDAFKRAEAEFGPIKELNERLFRLAKGEGEGGIAKLLGAAKETHGDVRLLAQLQRTMKPEDFQQIGGQLLHELGNKGGEFSLAKFTTEFGKLSDRSKQILFSPQHLSDIENIAHLGQHIKGALKESSTSHSASLLVFLEIAGHAAGIVSDIYHGTAGLGTAASVAGPAALYTMTHWLANPVAARAMSNWTTAYRAVTLGQPTPARVAAFRIATRNLAHNLNVPIENVTRAIENRLPVAATEPSPDNQRPKVPGPSR